MHYKKSTLFFFLLLLFSQSIFSQENKKPLVVASASMFSDMAANIGGDLIETATIVPIGGDPHIYEPTPGDVRLILQANLILKNGLTFEGWIQELIANSGATADVVTITEGIEPIVSEKHQNATDPHAWMEPVNGKIYATNIKNALLKLLPEHVDQINKQYNSYISQLDELDKYIQENIAKIEPKKRILITSHDSFHYYGRRYNIRLESVLGTSTDADVRTSDLMRLNQVIRENNIPVVFIESTINPKLLNQVASDNKISIGGKLYSDSLGDEDSPANTYINMVRYNTDVIVKGLTSKKSDVATSEAESKDHSKWFIWLGVLFLVSFFAMWLFRKKPNRA
jgi:ABC-type Zn uptake system ZnuABC Zn-binding protein ZnuA